MNMSAHLFSRAVATSYHQLGNFKQRESVFSKKSRHRWGWALLEVLQENVFAPSLLWSGGCQHSWASLSLWRHRSNPHFLLCVSKLLFFLGGHLSSDLGGSSVALG